MRRMKWTAVCAAAIAGAVGCGAETGAMPDATEDGAGEVGEATQELRNGFQAFVRVNAAGGKMTSFSAITASAGTITTSKVGLGNYQVTLGGLSGGGTGGNVQVVALGDDPTRCKVATWNLISGNVEINVRCFNSSGGPADSGFTARYAKVLSSTGFGTGAYLRITNSDSSTPIVGFPWNSTGGTNTVVRPAGTTGVFTVTLGGLALTGGAFQVTATGTNPDHCKISSWGGIGGNQVATVRCFNNAGAPTNTNFSLNYIGAANSVGIRDRGAFVWANDPVAGLYFPSASFSKNTGNTAGVCTATNVAGRLPNDPSIYIIQHENLPWSGGNPHVTAYGTDSTYCKVRDYTGSTGVEVQTRCYAPGGVAVTSRYVETYARKDSPGPC